MNAESNLLAMLAIQVMIQETIASAGKRTMILNMGPQHPYTHSQPSPD